MTSLALINELIGLPANASEHGYQIDHIIEFCHWFMGALFVGWSALFHFCPLAFSQKPQPGGQSRRRDERHLDPSGICGRPDRSGPARRLRHSALGEASQRFPEDKDAILVHAIGQQFNWNFHLPGPDGVFGRRERGPWSATRIRSDSIRPIPAAKDDLVVLGELHVPVDRNVIIDAVVEGCDPQFLPAEHAHRAGCDSRAGHSDVVQADQDRHLRGRLRSALRPRALRHERDAGGRHAGGLSSLVEGTGRNFPALKARRAAPRTPVAPPPGAPKTANPGGG